MGAESFKNLPWSYIKKVVTGSLSPEPKHLIRVFKCFLPREFLIKTIPERLCPKRQGMQRCNLKYISWGGLERPRTDSSWGLQRTDCHKNTYLPLLIPAWATEIYYLEWQQGSISANSSVPLEEWEQLRGNYYPSKYQSSFIPLSDPNTDHKVILLLWLEANISCFYFLMILEI